MPELPEVETIRRGLCPHIESACVRKVEIRQRQLRWPIPETVDTELLSQRLIRVERRAKYLLFSFGHVTAIAHLGMSGVFRLARASDEAWEKHEHWRWYFDNGTILRYLDPRRFGFLTLHMLANPTPKFLSSLGPEPLSEDFNVEYLYQRSRGRRSPIKNFIMDQKVVAGVGNIYACEALFLSGIRPQTPSCRVGRGRLACLVNSIKQVIDAAIAKGGTTVKDFIGAEGKPGYFAQNLAVYGREGMPCLNCNTPIRRCLMSGRSIFYCSKCQR